MAKAKSITVKNLFSEFNQGVRDSRKRALDDIKVAETRRRALNADAGVRSIVGKLNAPVAALLRRESRDILNGRPWLITTPYMYVGYEWVEGQAQMMPVLNVVASLTRLTGFKDERLLKVLAAWLGAGDAVSIDPVVTTNENAAALKREYAYRFTSNACTTLPMPVVATLHAGVASPEDIDKPVTCRREVTTVEEVVQRKVYTLVCD